MNGRKKSVFACMNHEAMCRAGMYDFRFRPKDKTLFLPECVKDLYGWDTCYEDMTWGFVNRHVAPAFREKVRSRCEDFCGGGTYMSCDFQLDNSPVWLRISMSRREEEEEVFGILQEVTEEYSGTAVSTSEETRKTEEEIKRVLADALALAEQANQAKTEFLSRMSHDIRTPMNAIMGMVTIAQAHMEDSEKVEECLEQISRSSLFLLGLINDILDLAKIENGSMSVVNEKFDFRAMVTSLISMSETAASEKGQRFSLELADNVERYYMGDEVRLHQVLLNLLSNASKYTEDGGSFSLRVEKDYSTDNYSLIRFTVQDSGIGISREIQKKLFEPFSQEKLYENSGGSGLGLAIAQNLVHLMNGTMVVESNPGEGSCFVVEVPLQNVEDTRKHFSLSDLKKEQAKSEYKFHWEKVLVAEDNVVNQEIVKTILGMKNIQVDIANDGREAVERFENCEPGEYLAIFMDIQMPRMDGYEATEYIRHLNHPEAAEIPIYAMTANAFSADAIAARASGMNGHIAKPIDFDKVIRVLADIIEEK